MEKKVHNNDGWVPASSRGKRRGQQKQKTSNKATFKAPSTGSRHAQGKCNQQRNAAADIGPDCSTGTPSTDGRGKKVFIPSCRASRIKQPARRKDFMRGLYPCSQSDDSSEDSLICSSSQDDEDRTLSQVASQIHTDLLFLNINRKYDLQDGDLLHNFADKLDVIVKLNVACPLSLTGLERLKSRGILDEEDSQEIAALVKACKGNVQGFASWKAMHAHACSYQDAYHSRIRRFLEESKGVAPVKTNSVGKVAPDALPLVEPTDLEAVYRSLSFPTPLKYLDPPVIELSGLNGSMDSTAKIMQFVVRVLPEILSDSDKSLVVSVHFKFGEGAIFMKRAAIQLCTNNKGRAAAHCLLTRIDNSKVLHPIHDADVMRYSYPKLYKKLYID